MRLPHIEVVTAASTENLAVLADLKTELGITGSGDDTRLALLISAVSRALCSPRGLRRPAWRATYKIRVPADGSTFLYLPRFPIESVVSVHFSKEIAANLVDPTTYEIFGQPDRLQRLHRIDESWLEATDDPISWYIVQVIAGWIEPDVGTPPGGSLTMPEDMVRGALMACVTAWKSRGIDMAIQSQSFEGLRRTYRAVDQQPHAIPDGAYNVMHWYR